MKYIVILEETNWSNKTKYTYHTIGYEDNIDAAIVYNYHSSSKKENLDIIKPISFSTIKGHTLKDYEESCTNMYGKPTFQQLPNTPEDYKLYIPKEYKCKELKVITNKDNNITNEMFEKIKKVQKNSALIAIDEDLSKRFFIDKYSQSDINKYFCTKCKKTFFKENKSLSRYSSNSCPICEAKFSYSSNLVLKDFKSFRQKEYTTNSYSVTFNGISSSSKERFYFMAKHPEDENGLIIYKICHEILAEKETISENYIIEYSIEHIVGTKMKCFKHLKKSKKECDPFEALNINTKNIQSPPAMLYENADTFLEFATQNEKFLRMSGFQAVLKYSPMKVSLEGFFIVFIGILNKYPIMEQIVKMGHAKLYFNLYRSMLQSLNKDEISAAVERISELTDNDAKTGKSALRFPVYIGDYLIKKDASLEEYYYWRDLYEITKLTKEQFENLIDSFNYAWINSQVGVSDIGNILKFDYQVDKLFNYIVKQSKKNKLTIKDTITYLTDYLNMCDMLQVEPDKYSQNIKKIHDDMLVHYRDRKQQEYNAKLTLIGTQCEKYVIPDELELKSIGIPKLFETMTVVFPKNENDFINEGNQQHNCVGSYPNKVRNGYCIIFFIRYKNNPTKSFITAECTKSGLGQCFYSNNRRVTDKDLVNFAKYIANKINTGCRSGKISGLQNI